MLFGMVSFGTKLLLKKLFHVNYLNVFSSNLSRGNNLLKTLRPFSTIPDITFSTVDFISHFKYA